MNERIKQLQSEIQAEERKISQCRHEFCKDKQYSPFKDSFGTIKKDRWYQACIHCGLEKHTY